MDVVTPEVRSRMMSSIKSGNTKPEMAVRRYLYSRGYRYRLHVKSLPGCPDLVLSKYRVVIFVHGCFWHRHEGCRYSYSPSSRTEFWHAKFAANLRRDEAAVSALLQDGWKVRVIWECGIKHLAEIVPELLYTVVAENVFLEWPPEPPRKAASTEMRQA